jgi:peptidoglycan/xylan/chitin deacetylase (PgdA/CDA1 family)
MAEPGGARLAGGAQGVDADAVSTANIPHAHIVANPDRPGVPILLYHSVSADPPAWIAPFAVSLRAFERHLELVRALRATALTVREYASLLCAGSALPERPVLITFDDGLLDFRREALPRLAAAHLPATLFVVSGFVDETGSSARPAGPWLDAGALAALHAEGIEIGAHSRTHPHLDTLPTSMARDEIAGSKAALEEILQAPVDSFAYPHGYLGPATSRLVRESGFAAACAVKNAFSSVEDDRFALARLTVRADTSEATLAGWLSGTGAPLAPRREPVRTWAWRVYRRGRAVVSGEPGSDWTRT